MAIINLPNLISLFRLLTTPVLIWLVLVDAWTGVFFLFVVAGLSDAADGFIAKKFNAVTRLGEFLDPIADKVLLVSIFLSLGYAQKIPDWLVILVVSRDVLIVGGVLLLYALDQDIRIRPIWSSKANTCAPFSVLGTHVIVGNSNNRFLLECSFVIMDVFLQYDKRHVICTCPIWSVNPFFMLQQASNRIFPIP